MSRYGIFSINGAIGVLFPSRRFSLQTLNIALVLVLLSVACANTQVPAELDSAPRKVTAGAYISPPFVEERNGRYRGMAVELWERAVANIGLVTDYKTYPTFFSLLKAVETGEIDVAITNLSITRGRAERMDFTQPWYDSGLRIMVPDREIQGFNSVFHGLGDAGHLRAYLWLVFVVVLATVGLALFDRKFDPDAPRRWPDALAESFYHVVSIAVSGKTTRKNLFGWIGRIWQAFWVMSGVAVIAYVTSSVTSVMTAVSLENSITSLADLQGRTAAVFTGSVAEDYVTGLGIASRSYPDVDAAADALSEGYVAAVVADAPTLEHFVHTHPEREFTVVGRLFHPDKYGFAFPLESELSRKVMLEILDLQENGEIAELRLKYFGHAP